jgi:hypothetical protein
MQLILDKEDRQAGAEMGMPTPSSSASRTAWLLSVLSENIASPPFDLKACAMARLTGSIWVPGARA